MCDDAKKRVNQGYGIIESVKVGKKEFVIGFNPKAPNPYVTWVCRGEDDYVMGHYMNTQLAAQKDLYTRALDEVSYLESIQESRGSRGQARTKNQERER